MRAANIVLLAVMVPGVAAAQLLGAHITGGVGTSITGSPGCSECDWGRANQASLGLSFGVLTLGAHHVSWRALENPGQSMSFDLAGFELGSREGRFRPIVGLALGRGSVALDQSWGGHYEDKYSTSNSLAFEYAMRIDIYLSRHLALAPGIAVPSVRGVDRTACMTSYNSFGQSSTTCGPQPSTSFRFTAFGIGLGWR